MRRKRKLDHNQLDLYEVQHQKELLARGKEFAKELEKELQNCALDKSPKDSGSDKP